MHHDGGPTSFREYWKRDYGPTIAVYRANAADAAQTAALDRDFHELLTGWNHAHEQDRTACTAEYLLVTARRA